MIFMLIFYTVWDCLFWGIIILISCAVWDWLFWGPCRSTLFCAVSPILADRPWLAAVFGVRHIFSDEGKMSRNTSLLPLGFLTWLFGTEFQFGNKIHLTKLKTLQRVRRMPLELVERLAPLVGKTVSLDEFEQHLIKEWLQWFPLAYDMPVVPPCDVENLVGAVVHTRRVISLMLSHPLTGCYYAWKNWSGIWPLRQHLKILKDGRDVLFMAPFFTTIDSTMFACLDQSPIGDLHEVFNTTPLSYLPVISHGKPTILRLRNNKVNNASNTVFGNGTFICPGNNVTFEVLRCLYDIKQAYHFERVGPEPIFKDYGVVKVISNTQDISLTITAKNK